MRNIFQLKRGSSINYYLKLIHSVTNYGTIEWCECLNWDSGGSEHPGFYFKEEYEYGERGCLDYHTGFDKDIEVIGNIYENKELLKEETSNATIR